MKQEKIVTVPLDEYVELVEFQKKACDSRKYSIMCKWEPMAYSIRTDSEVIKEQDRRETELRRQIYSLKDDIYILKCTIRDLNSRGLFETLKDYFS